MDQDKILVTNEVEKSLRKEQYDKILAKFKERDELEAAQKKKKADGLTTSRIKPISVTKKVVLDKIEFIKKVDAKIEVAKAKAEDAAKAIETAVLTVDSIPAPWISSYEEETGKKAIWKGQITQGFRDFINKNGLKK